MIKLSEGQLLDIWPDKSDPEMIALSAALKWGMDRMLQYSRRAMVFANIDELPDNVLDYLAVEMRAMYYDQNGPIEQKRAIIKKALFWYIKAGTSAAVKELLQVVFGEADLVEWPDYTEPPYTPGTFDVKTGAVMTPQIIKELTDLIRKVKNARSHIRRAVVKRDVPSGMHAVIRGVSVQDSIVGNQLRGDAQSENPISVGGIAAGDRSTEVLNTTSGAAESSGSVSAGGIITSEGDGGTVLNYVSDAAETTGTTYAGSQVGISGGDSAIINSASEDSKLQQDAVSTQLGLNNSSQSTIVK